MPVVVQDIQRLHPRIFNAGYCDGHSTCECPDEVFVIRLRLMPLVVVGVDVGNKHRVLHDVLVVDVLYAPESSFCARICVMHSVELVSFELIVIASAFCFWADCLKSVWGCICWSGFQYFLSDNLSRAVSLWSH